jgi:PAS domain S-box-containing protein
LFTLQIENDELLGIAWMSENVQALLGYSVSETLGPDWWMDNIHTEDRDAVVNPFLADLLNQGYAAAEYRFRHKNGHFRWVRGEARVLRDVSGGIAEVIGSLSDITERKRLENQFWQAQKMEAVGHLAGGVAHDFNNLLTIIIGYSDLVLPDLPPDEREMIAEIRHAADRAAGLTRQLLAFSRRTVLEPKILSLNELVRDHEKMLRRLIGEDVQLTTNLDAAIEPVRADPGQLGQVIMNLAVNARDAMPTGGRLTIETKSVTFDDATAGAVGDAKAGRYVVLAVTDSGIGMTPDVRAHLFEPFFTTKGPGKGTGLGLATVYGIVKQSGGFIAVESEPGRGSVFAIHFPVVATSVPAEPASAGTPLARGTETILVVEDEDAVRSMIRAVLGKAGYQVLQARSGPEALRIAAEHRERIHLLVTDVVMPEMSGRDVVEHLARQRRDFKVLYLSGYTDDAVVRHRVLEAEVAFLQKPFTMSTLTTKVRQLLDESAG